jgi:hypothetical protein
LMGLRRRRQIFDQRALRAALHAAHLDRSFERCPERTRTSFSRQRAHHG